MQVKKYLGNPFDLKAGLFKLVNSIIDTLNGGIIMNYVKYISLISLITLSSLQAVNVTTNEAIDRAQKLVITDFKNQVVPLPKIKQIAELIRAVADNGMVDEKMIKTIVVSVVTEDKRPEHLINLHSRFDDELISSMQPNVAPAPARKHIAAPAMRVQQQQSPKRTQEEEDRDFALALQMQMDLEQ